MEFHLVEFGLLAILDGLGMHFDHFFEMEGYPIFTVVYFGIT